MGNSTSSGLGSGSARGFRDVRTTDPETEVQRPPASPALIKKSLPVSSKSYIGSAVTKYRRGGRRNLTFMRRKFLGLTVKKSVYIYESYRKIKTGVLLFWTTGYSMQFAGGSFATAA